MYPQALFSFLLLMGAWGYFFWPHWSVYFNPHISWTIFLFDISIIAICVYIIFEKSLDFRKVIATSSQAGMLCFFIFALVWIMAGVTHQPDLQQSISLMMIPALILSIFGPFVSRIILFPLVYFLLIIPFYYSNPAERLLIAWFAFAVAFSYMRYTRYGYRLIFSLMGIVIPLVIIGLQLKPLIPSIIALILFLVCGYFLTEPRRFYGATRNIQFRNDLITKNARWFMPTTILFFIMVTAPWLSNNIRSSYPEEEKRIVLIAPESNGAWQGPKTTFVNWDPNFANASTTIKVEYDNKALPSTVYLFSAYYRSDKNVDAVLKSQNTLYDPSTWKKVNTELRTVPINRNTSMTVIETLLEKDGNHQLIWSWFFTMGFASVDATWLTLLDKIRSIAKYADGTGIIAVSTDAKDNIDQARNDLESFLKEMYPALEILERPAKVSF